MSDLRATTEPNDFSIERHRESAPVVEYKSRLDLEEVAQAIRTTVGERLRKGYGPGRQRIRRVIVTQLGQTPRRAEELLEKLEERGWVRYRRRRGRRGWHVSPPEPRG